MKQFLIRFSSCCARFCPRQTWGWLVHAYKGLAKPLTKRLLNLDFYCLTGLGRPG